MQKTIPLIIIGCSLLTLLTGCVAFFIPKNQTVTINTQNDSAEVHFNNPKISRENGFVGRGKTVQFTKRKLGPKQVIIKADGYEDSYYIMMPEKRANIFWPLWILDFPLIVFAVPPLEYGFSKKSVLYAKSYEFPLSCKLLYRERQQKKVTLLGINRYANTGAPKVLSVSYQPHGMEQVILETEQKYEADLSAKQQSWAKVQGIKPNNLIEPTPFRSIIEDRLYNGNFTDSITNVFFDHINTVGLEGVITKNLLFKIKGEHLNSNLSSYVKSKIEMTWYLVNSYAEKTDSFHTSAYSGDFIAGSFIEDKAIIMNYYALFQDKKFLSCIQTDSGTHVPQTSVFIKNTGEKITSPEEGLLASVIIKRDDDSYGSGFAISNDGYILTAYHVIAGEYINNPAGFKVILANGASLPGKVISINRKHDIALIKVDTTFKYCYSLTNQKSYRQTTPIYTIGAPKSLELVQSLSLGMISNERGTNQNPILQLNISVNDGNIGGPLFEKNGTLHGLLTSKLVGFSTEGIAFAIPSYKIAEYLNLVLVE